MGNQNACNVVFKEKWKSNLYFLLYIVCFEGKAKKIY